MAGDARYGTVKRKYEEEQASPALASTRRATGFSAPINSSGPDSGHVPIDEIELAKQKAQEIAARLFSSASSLESKRPRVENISGDGGGYDYNDKGFSSIPSDYSQTHTMSTPASYGFQGSSKKVQIPNGRVGVIIGKAGETIKYLQLQSGAKIQITRDADAEPGSNMRAVDLVGTPEAIAKAEQLINDVLSEAETGGSGQGPRRGPGPSGFTDQFVMKIPNNKVGLVIGKGGETIKNMQATTGARIQVIPLHLPPGDTSLERTLQIDGTSEQIESAKLLVNEVISENRPRNSSMGGGYSQQGYQARPPTNWSQPGPPMQQYGYVQPGAYSGPTPQYQQQSYGAYPNQPNSGGYSSNQNTEGSGYDYYNQQPSQGGPGSTDTTGYNYNQQQATGYTQQGQGYSQDGYSTGYNAPAQSGYIAPAPPQSGYNAPAPQSGYNQQPQSYDLQGYNAPYGSQGGTTQAPPTAQPPATSQAGYPSQPGYGVPPPVQSGYGYGTGYAAPQAQKSPAGQSTYGQTQQSPTAQGAYGVPPPAQIGYGTQQSGYGPGYAAPQAQKSPASQSTYGQTQQSPAAQGAYGQPGYPPSHTGYAQPDSTTKQSPSSLSTAPAQSGYGVPQYGAAGYAQQPPAYSANPAAGGAPQTGAPKASPQS